MKTIIEPEIRKENGQTKVWAVAEGYWGFGPLRGMYKFCLEARKYERELYVRREDSNDVCSLKNMHELQKAWTSQGCKIEIIVEGVDAEAEHIAKRIYSGIVSEDSITPNFCNLEQNCPLRERIEEQNERVKMPNAQKDNG